MLFVASEDFTFCAVDPIKRTYKWEFTSGLPIRKGPVAIDNDLYVLPDRGGMYCLDPNSGARRWWKPELNNFVAVTGGSVAASDADGNLTMVSRSSGETIGSIPLRRFTVRTGNDRTDRIFVATESGLVMCLRQIGHPYPVYHRFPDRLPLLPEIEPEDSGEAPAETTDAQPEQ